MARTPQRVVERNLLKVPVLIEDTVSYSKYFEVSRLNPNFHAGKNGFLIRGTQYLKNGTLIQVEVLDRYGKTVFSNVIGNYSEGDARLVSVEITQKTRKGPGKLVVVGTATNYEDGRPIPSNQQNRPNVRWVFPIDIDASRRNTSKLILQNTPAQILNGLSVTRTDFNTTSRTDAFVTSSTYTASLDYDFEGHRSDGYAITMLDSSGNPTPFFDDVSIDGYFTGSLYKREISNLYDTGVLVPDSQSIVLNYVTASVYTPLFKTLNETLAITEKSIKFSNGDDYLNPILYSGSYSRVLSSVGVGANLVRKIEEEITSSVMFEYPTETLTTSANNSSILNFRIPYTQTHTGEIAKVRISAKEANPEITAYQLLTEFNPSERNILVTGSNTGNVSIGRFLTNDRLQNYWQSGLVNIADYENSQSVNPITLVTSSAEILEGFYADHTESAVPYFFGTQEFYQLYQGVQYTLKYDAVYNPTYVSSSTTYSTTDTGSVKAYLTRIGSDTESKNSSSVVIATKNGVTNTYGLLVDEVNTKNNDKGLYERRVNFTPERDGFAYLRYIVDSGFWNFSNFVITPAVEYGYNPDEIVVYAEDTILTGTTYIFKIEFIGWAGDISDEFISDPIDIPAKGGGASLRLITDRTVFTFNSDGDPFPTQQTASVDVLLTNVTNTPTFTLVDDLDVPVDTQFYSASNGNLNFDVYVGAFGDQTASLGTAATSSLLLTVSASAGGDIVQDKLRFVRAKDAADGTPGAPGADGEGARSIKVTLSDYSVVYEQDGINPTPTSITASATTQNLEGNQYVYNFYRTGSFLTRVPAAGTTTDTSATASFVVPSTDDYKQQNIEVEVSESGVFVARDVEDFVGVTPGEDGWSIILTNTSHTLPADNDGNVSFPAGFVGSGTKIEVLKGANNLRPWTGSGLLNGYFSASVFESQSVNQPDKTGSVTLSGSTPTYVEFGDLNAMDVSSDLGSITFKIVAITGSNTYEFFQVQSFTKSQQGAPGSDGSGSRTTKLTLSDYSIVYDRYGLNPSPTSLTASAYHQNLEAPVTFSFYRTGSELITHSFASVPPSPVTASFTTPPSDNYTSQIVEVEVSESANGVAFDNNEFYGVTPGLDGWTVILTNEAHTFPASSSGEVTSFVGGGTDIEVLFGSDNLSPWTGSAGGDLPYGSFSASIVDSGSVNQPDKTGSVAELNGEPTYVRFADPTSMDISSDTGFITYEITAKSGSDLNPIIRTFTKKQSFTKSKEGPAGENAYVYYITPLDGLQFKTNAQGTTTPNRLIFQTQRSTGSAIQDVPSGSFDGDNFGLFYSGSNLPVSGSPGSSYYTASADDIFERAVIRYLTGSGAIGSRYIADSVSVEDLTDGQDGITPILEVSGAITFNSSSAGVLPTGTSSITGSLLRGATSLGIITSSITPSSTTGFTVNAVGSSSVNVSSSWQLTADKDGTPIGYNFKFFSGSIGSYTQVGAQPFNINIDGKDGPPGVDPPPNIVFTVDPATQVICRDYNETITSTIPPVVITATEGQDVLAYNDPTSDVGEWNFIRLYGIPSQSTTPVMTDSSFGGGAGGQINFDHTQIKQTGSGQFIAYAEIEYTSSLNITGSIIKSFTLTKQNCYDPCSPTVVELDRYNQTVNSITGSLQSPPENFKAIVTQDGDQLTYQSGVSSESTFDYLSISQSSAVGPATDNGDGTITPADPSTLNTSEVHTLVRYKDNCGITATFPATHSINVIFEGSVGPGIVVTGVWTGSQAYTLSDAGDNKGIRDIVLWWTPEYAAASGSVPGDPTSFNGYPINDADTEQYLISYYAASKTHTSEPSGSGNEFDFGPPHISTGSIIAVSGSGEDPAWEYLGDEERFVAAKIGIFRESFIWNTLNIGTNATTQSDPLNNVKANITLAGGTNTPYISIGQTTQDYGEGGVFIGSGSGAKLSLSGSEGGMFWDGSELTIDAYGVPNNAYLAGLWRFDFLQEDPSNNSDASVKNFGYMPDSDGLFTVDTQTYTTMNSYITSSGGYGGGYWRSTGSWGIGLIDGDAALIENPSHGVDGGYAASASSQTWFVRCYFDNNEDIDSSDRIITRDASDGFAWRLAASATAGWSTVNTTIDFGQTGYPNDRTVTITSNRWITWCLSFDYTNDIARLFVWDEVDGMLEDFEGSLTADPGAYAEGPRAVKIAENSENNLRDVAQSSNRLNSARYDEVRFYTKAFTKQEFLKLSKESNSVGTGTRISGDQIQTGKIKSNNWSGPGSPAGSMIDLNSGQLHLGGSGSNAALLWDGSTLDVDGAISASSGRFYGSVSVESGGKIYVGTGTYASSDTPFYVDSNNQFSLGDKLTWDGSVLNVSGSISASSGYFSGSLFAIGGKFAQSVTVGDDIVLDGLNTKIYVGTGTYANSNTPFYLTGSGDFSLGDKLTWDGSALDIDGVISASAGLFSGTVTVGSGDRIKIGPGEEPVGATDTRSAVSPRTVVNYGNPSTPFTFTKSTNFNGDTLSGVDIGDYVSIYVSIDDLRLGQTNPGNDPDIQNIDNMVFTISQGGVDTTYSVGGSGSYAAGALGTNHIRFTASYSPVNASNLSFDFTGDYSLESSSLDSGPEPRNLSLFTSSLSSSVVQPTLAISNDGIFFNRGNGIESLFSLEGGGGGGTSGGGTTYSAGTGLDLAGTTFNLALGEVIDDDGADRVLTSDADGTLTAEANLKFNGTNLTNGSNTFVETDNTGNDNELAVWTTAKTIEGDGNLTWDGTTLALAGARTITQDSGKPVVDKTGTVAANQLAIWNDTTNTITGDTDLTFDGTTLTLVGNLNVSGNDLYVNHSNGRVGIHTNSPSYGLQVTGTGVEGTIAADIDVIVTSDIRLKNVEGYVSGGLIIVNNLNPIKYTWKDKEDTKLHIGLSAQEVLQYVPEAVYGSEETQYGVSYGKLVPVLIDAVKELTTRIEELEKQLEDRD